MKTLKNTILTDKITGITTEINYNLNWYKMFDYDGFLITQGIHNKDIK